jgi:restriction system protein
MKVLQKLLDLTAVQFEEFAGALLRGYGFQKVIVTAKSGDGGIDGHGELTVGMAVMKAALPMQEVEGLRSDRKKSRRSAARFRSIRTGLLFATSTFKKAAQQESLKSGAAPGILFGGDQVVQIMIEKGIGVRSRADLCPRHVGLTDGRRPAGTKDNPH